MRLEYRTDKRGYVMWIERDLLGDIVLYRRWFGLHNRRGGMKQQMFLNENDALREIRRIDGLRRRRGYKRLDTPSS